MTRTSAAAQFILTMKPGGGVANTAVPTHDGTAPVIGTEIAGTPGTWTGSPTLTYQWYKSLTNTFTVEAAVSGATAIDYTPLAADNVFGYYLRLAEIPNGVTASAAYSAATGVVTLTGIALWLDAADASTLFQASNGTTPATADNDPVGYWGDKSGNGRNAIQATAGNKPTLKLSQWASGKPTLYLTTDDYLATAYAPPDSNLTVFCVFDGSPAQLGVIISHDNLVLGINNDVSPSQLILSIITVKRSIDAPSGKALVSGTPSAAQTRLNGEVQTQKATATYGTASNVLKVGARDSGNYYTGYIAEILVYSPVLGAGDIPAVESYLASKWGITLNP